MLMLSIKMMKGNLKILNSLDIGGNTLKLVTCRLFCTFSHICAVKDMLSRPD